MLGQMTLVEAAPSKRLIVPVGAVNFYGVDPSTLRVAIATVTPDGLRGADIASFPKLSGAHRLVAIRRDTYALACEIVESIPPGVIVVEKPSGFGSRPSPELSFAGGAIMCALQEAAPAAAIELVENTSWKRVVCGSGAIKKPKPTEGVEYPVLLWARDNGYIGSSWDVADAMAIAEYGRRTYALEQR